MPIKRIRAPVKFISLNIKLFSKTKNPDIMLVETIREPKLFKNEDSSILLTNKMNLFFGFRKNPVNFPQKYFWSRWTSRKLSGISVIVHFWDLICNTLSVLTFLFSQIKMNTEDIIKNLLRYKREEFTCNFLEETINYFKNLNIRQVLKIEESEESLTGVRLHCMYNTTDTICYLRGRRERLIESWILQKINFSICPIRLKETKTTILSYVIKLKH